LGGKLWMGEFGEGAFGSMVNWALCLFNTALFVSTVLDLTNIVLHLFSHRYKIVQIVLFWTCFSFWQGSCRWTYPVGMRGIHEIAWTQPCPSPSSDLVSRLPILIWNVFIFYSGCFFSSYTTSPLIRTQADYVLSVIKALKEILWLAHFQSQQFCISLILMGLAGVGDYLWSNCGITDCLMHGRWTCVIWFLNNSKSRIWILWKARDCMDKEE
jgi:hypothetical protein